MTDNPSGWRPPTPYEPGNLAAVTHGAYSPRMVSDLAAEIAAAAVAAAPELSLDRFAFALRAWSHAEARCELFRRHLDVHGVMNNRNTPRLTILTHLATSERAASRGRDELGLSPRAAVAILAGIREARESLLSPTERSALNV